MTQKRCFDKKYIYRVVGILLFALLVFLFLWRNQDKEAKQYQMVFLGDSVVGNVPGGQSMTEVMEQRLGKTVFNGAFGGTSMSLINEDLRGSKASSQWSMVELARAICYEDWGSQRASLAYAKHYQKTNTQMLDYFPDRLLELSQIDFDGVEILLIEHGTNDYGGGQILENPEDVYDVETFGGALRTILSMLQEKWPKLRIVLVTPIYCELGENGSKKCYNTDYGGGIMDAYVEKEKQIAEEFGVEIIDAYHESGIWEDTVADYLEDRLHPSEAGHSLLGNFIADYFLNNK